MQMANSNSERVRSVAALKLFNTEQASHHTRDLFFIGVSETYGRLLHCVCAVLKKRNSRLENGEHRNSARLSQLQSRNNVFREENFFNRDMFGTIFRDELFYASVNFKQTLVGLDLRIKTQCAISMG